MGLSRRHFSRTAALLPLAWTAAPILSVRAAPNEGEYGITMAAAWQAGDVYRVGWLSLKPGRMAMKLAAIDVPTRAHHVGVDGAGRLLAVARRPGDWLLRWGGARSAPEWRWIEASRSFNGHAVTSPDGRRVFTTETDLDSGAGLIGVRDALTLAKLDEWPTGGTDPHQLIWHPQTAQSLYVANGGIATRPETGRIKHDLARMDSSLVRLDVRSGQLAGQWRLADPRLSLRHLAWQGPQLGVALQAEHEQAEARALAPVLATFDGHELRAAPAAPMPLAGYGGDIAANLDGFTVSCPRAGGLARFDAQGRWQAFAPLAQACALAHGAQGELLAGGEPRGTMMVEAAAGPASPFDLGPLRLDNHWTWASRSLAARR